MSSSPTPDGSSAADELTWSKSNLPKYEGNFYEKYMAYEMLKATRYLDQSEPSTALTRRTSWFENRRYMFEPPREEEDEEPPFEMETNESVHLLEPIGENIHENVFEQNVYNLLKSMEQEESFSFEFNNENNMYLITDEQPEENITAESGSSSDVRQQTSEDPGASETKWVHVDEREAREVAVTATAEDQHQRGDKVIRMLGMTEAPVRTGSSRGQQSSKRVSSKVKNIKQKIQRTLSGKSLTKPANRTTYEDDEGVVWSKTLKDAEEYLMNHQRRGTALIFVNSAQQQRQEWEWRELQTQLGELGFEVQVYHDLTLGDMKTVLFKTSQIDHSNADCLVVVVLTTIQGGSLFAKNLPYKEQRLWKFFKGDKCESLAGKPKLFFIDAVSVPTGAHGDVTDDVSISYMIPVEADILTAKWYHPWQKEGSLYLRVLCEELNRHGQSKDILKILTFVNRGVCVSGSGEVEMPSITSMLTRRVFFRSKS